MNKIAYCGSRDLSLDIARGIAIILVIFGHITHIAIIRRYIWSFHLPLFFFISGLLFYQNKYPSFPDYCKSRVKRLLIPYVIFYLLTLLYWVLIERHTRGIEYTVESQIFGMLYGTYSLDYMYFNGVLWFIPCLFSIQIIYWFVCKLVDWKRMIAVMLLLSIAGLLLTDYLRWLPWGINAAMIAGIFYSMGDVSKCLYHQINNIGRPILASIMIIGLSLQCCLIPTTVTDLAALDIESVFFYIPLSCVGIVTYCLLSKIIAHNATLEWLGRNSLVFFAIHEPVYRAVIFMMSKLMHTNVEMVRSDFWLCLACTLSTILIIWPLALLWNKSSSLVINKR